MASGDGIQKLYWDDPSEILEYHSCGRADSCWIAEVKAKNSKKVKVRLRCDCDKMFALAPGKKIESEYRSDCKAFERNDKLKFIPLEIKKLMHSQKNILQ